MKNDPTFKVLALAILAGVIVSFVSPTHDSTPETHASPVVHVEAAPAASATE